MPLSYLEEARNTAATFGWSSSNTKHGHGGYMKILVVEDETAIRTMMVSALKRGGYNIVEAQDGAEALRLLGDGLALDALITDIRMPGADGWAVARAYRERYPDLPVLYVTGQADDMLPVPGGVLVGKPFRMSQVLPVLSRLIQLHHAQQGMIAGAA